MIDEGDVLICESTEPRTLKRLEVRMNGDLHLHLIHLCHELRGLATDDDDAGRLLVEALEARLQMLKSHVPASSR